MKSTPGVGFLRGESASSNQENPVVTYAVPGSYSVNLTVGDGTSSYEVVKDNYIAVEEPAAVPTVDFTVNRSDLFTGQEVQFQDASDASVFSWGWVFEKANLPNQTSGIR